MWAAQYLQVRAAAPLAHVRRRRHDGLWAAGGDRRADRAIPTSWCVCVSGDASVLMNIQELSTAVQHRTPVKLVLCNNGYMGMVRQWQELNHAGRYSHSYTAALPDFVAVAKGFGWGAKRVSDPSRARRCDRGMPGLRRTVLPRCGSRRAGELLSDDCRGLRAPPGHAGREELLYGCSRASRMLQ